MTIYGLKCKAMQTELVKGQNESTSMQNVWS